MGNHSAPFFCPNTSDAIKAEMRTELTTLEAGLPNNTGHRLGERRGKSWITLTPLDPSRTFNIIRIGRWPHAHALMARSKVRAQL